ncbi:MAG TPA: hypothetical protein VFQ00_01630 [Terriglobales bacterium]|nr:hypothetical protein [Terriglobales bacterium]
MEISVWVQHHPISFAITLSVLGSFISIYSGSIRRFLAIPPQKLNIEILKARISNAQDTLKTLNLYKNDIHALIVEIGETLLVICMTGLVLSLGLVEFLIRHVASLEPKPLHGDRVFWSLIIGVVIIAAIKFTGTSWILVQLRFYDWRNDSLQKKIVRLDRKLDRLSYAKQEPDPFNNFDTSE